MNTHTLSDRARLNLLRENDPLRRWTSLDDNRICMACGRKLTGRTIRIFRRGHRVLFECPTAGCVSGLAEFAAPGDPLHDDDVWRDWELTLNAVETAADELDDLPDRANQAGHR